MANKRPAHRRGTTTRSYRRAQANAFKGKYCARCGGLIVKTKCDPAKHPTHAKLAYCPTDPLAPSLGHKTDLQHGGSVLAASNHQLEHYGCNASAGSKARWAKQPKTVDHRHSWDW